MILVRIHWLLVPLRAVRNRLPKYSRRRSWMNYICDRIDVWDSRLCELQCPMTYTARMKRAAHFRPPKPIRR